MAIRKEQVLALIALAIGGWLWNAMGGLEGNRNAFTPKQREYAVAPIAQTALAGEGSGTARRRSLFTQPSETQPLPPRALDFPLHAPLSVAALPLDPGPDFGHALLLREDGAVVEGVTLQTVVAAAAPAAEGAAEEQGPPATRQERAAIARKTYDQVFQHGQTGEFFGFVEVVGVDPYTAEKLTDFEGKIVKLRHYSLETGKIDTVIVWGNPGDLRKVREIKLADNLRNAVERKKREFPIDGGHLVELGKLIQWLLDQAREASWVYDEAIAHADLYLQQSGGDLEGLRWQQRVLRAKGDLAREFALLDGITGVHRETAFRYEGLGVVKAQLGLHADAEQDLRKATTLAPNDARPHGALAEFLRQRGRMREAAAASKRAEVTFGSLLDPTDRVRIARTIVSCHLGLGAIDAARAARKLVGADVPQHYLDGCIDYAAGKVGEALGAFRQVVSGDDLGASLLGQGACLLRQKLWQDAHDAFAAVADQHPLLRHRACCGLALLHLRLGVFDGALGYCDRALEADPQDAYALYLRGRTLRMMGQLGPAATALGSALRLHDDFVHAIVEVAEVNDALAAGARGEEAAQGALAAVRYGDRAVALAKLAKLPTVELFEKQALFRFAAADASGAADAFGEARDAAAAEADKLYAKGAIAVVEYSRGSVEDSTVMLRRLTEDLAKEHLMRQWAETTLAAIDDHAQKEMLEDRFERNDLGAIWSGENDGVLRAAIQDSMLVFRGKWTRGDVTAERAGAVQRGKNFLAVATALRLAKSHPRDDTCFAGLRIQTQRGAGGSADSQIEVGVRGSKPYVRIVDDKQEPKWIELKIDGFDAMAGHELELRVVARDQQSRTFGLQVRWNGQLVHQQEIKSLSGSTGTELKTILFAIGSKGSECDVAFDDYRLERRKEVIK